MAEITRRRTGEMLRKLFEILMPVPERMQARDALAELEKRITLTEYERGEYASGGKRFDKIVRFATVDLVKAGWLYKEKGRWTVTAEGRGAYHVYLIRRRSTKRRFNSITSGRQPSDGVDEVVEEEPPGKVASVRAGACRRRRLD